MLIPPYFAFTDYTPTIPSVYWNVYSNEQRIKWLFKEYVKLIAYEQRTADIVNEQYDIIADMQARFPELVSEDVIAEINRLIASGQFSEYISEAVNSFIDSAQKEIWQSQRVRPRGIIGHRGVRRSAPANTKVSYELAGKWGVKFIETDVQKTFDGVFVCHHDNDIYETTNTHALIGDNEYSYLSSIPVTKGCNVEFFATQYLLKFEDYLNICKKYNATPVIEIKGETNTPETVIEICDIIKRNGFEKNCCIISFTVDLCIAARQANRYASIYLTGNSLAGSTPAWCLLNDIDGVNINVNGLNKSTVENVFGQGVDCLAWTNSEPNQYAAAVRYGVNAIAIDDICAISRNNPNLEYTKENGLRGYANGIPCMNQHEFDSASNYNFTSFIWRAPYPKNEYGVFTPPNRTSGNLKYCGTPPKLVKVGTIITIKQNSWYKFAAVTTDLSFQNAKSSEWFIAESGDCKYIVPPKNAQENYVWLSFTCIQLSETNQYNSEYYFDHASQFVELSDDVCELVFKTTNTDTRNYSNITFSNNRLVSPLYPWDRSLANANKIIAHLDDTYQISLMYFNDKGGLVINSQPDGTGWIDENNQYYNTETNEFTLSTGDYSYIAFHIKRIDSAALNFADMNKINNLLETQFSWKNSI